MTALYGLKNCDTCKKAAKWLDRFGVAYTFVDYRDNKPAPETLLEWAGKAGGFETLINKSSTTWRQLPENRKTAVAVAFISDASSIFRLFIRTMSFSP